LERKTLDLSAKLGNFAIKRQATWGMSDGDSGVKHLADLEILEMFLVPWQHFIHTPLRREKWLIVHIVTVPEFAKMTIMITRQMRLLRTSFLGLTVHRDATEAQ